MRLLKVPASPPDALLRSAAFHRRPSHAQLSTFLKLKPDSHLVTGASLATAAHEAITPDAAILTVSLHREAAIRVVEINKSDPARPTNSSAATATKLSFYVARFVGAGQRTSKARGAARMIE